MASGVKPFVQSGVASVSPEASVQHAARLLETSGRGVIAVVDRNRLVGVLHPQDVALSEPFVDHRLTEVKVSELLPADLNYCFEDTHVEEAVRLMRENHVDRLVVLDRDHRVIGAVTLATVTQERAD